MLDGDLKSRLLAVLGEIVDEVGDTLDGNKIAEIESQSIRQGSSIILMSEGMFDKLVRVGKDAGLEFYMIVFSYSKIKEHGADVSCLCKNICSDVATFNSCGLRVVNLFVGVENE